MQGFLAVGSEEGGNQITLNITDSSIHFIGMDQSLDINIHIAKYFTEFIDGLYPAPYRDDLDEIFKVGTLDMFQNFINRNKAILT